MANPFIRSFHTMSPQDREAVLNSGKLGPDKLEMLQSFQGMSPTDQAKTVSFGRPDVPVTQGENEKEQSFLQTMYETATLGGIEIPFVTGMPESRKEFEASAERRTQARKRFLRYVAPVVTMGTATAAAGAFHLGSKATVGLEALVGAGTEYGLQKAGFAPESGINIAAAGLASPVGRAVFAGPVAAAKWIGRWTGARPFLHEMFLKTGIQRLKGMFNQNEKALWDDALQENPFIDVGNVKDAFQKVAADLGRRAGANPALRRVQNVMHTLLKGSDEATGMVQLRQADAALRQSREMLETLAKKGGSGYGALQHLKGSMDDALDIAGESAAILKNARAASKFNAGLKQLEKYWSDAKTELAGPGSRLNISQFQTKVYDNYDELSAKLGPEALDSFTNWTSELGEKLPEVIPYRGLWDYVRSHPLFILGAGAAGGYSGGGPGLAATLGAILGTKAIGQHGGRAIGKGMPGIMRKALSSAALGAQPEYSALLAQVVRTAATDAMDKEGEPPKSKSELEKLFFGGA